MKLRLGLGFSHSAAGGPQGIPPTVISLSRTTVPEDLAVGLDVGLLSNDGTVPGTYSVVSDPDSKFAMNAEGDGVATDAALNFEADASHPVTVRFTYDGGTLDQPFTITVTDIDEAPSDPPDLPADNGTLVFDGGFEVEPSKGNSGSNLKLQGKSGGVAKFVFDIGAAEGSTTYTMRYDPDFSLLSNTGKEAFVGFGFKQSNDFHFAGLKGDGATGLDSFKLYGANKFNASSGFTTVDDGAPAHGTQAGPNWLQIEIAADGSTYTLRTSGDGEAWTDEFTDDLPDPLSNADDATTFGIAVFLENSDKGTFSIDIQVWAEYLPDPNWGDVVLLIEPAGANGSATFTDLSDSAHAITAFGNAQVNNGDALFDGTGDYLRMEDSVDWAFAAGDFTVELFVTPEAGFGNDETLISQWSGNDANQNAWHLDRNGGALRFLINNNAFSVTSGPWSVTNGVRQHVAVTRSGTTFRLYIAGNKVAESTSALSIINSTEYLALGTIGTLTTFNPLTGRERGIRITKGFARYTGDTYTIPTLPYPQD